VKKANAESRNLHKTKNAIEASPKLIREADGPAWHAQAHSGECAAFPAEPA
jgi:hypothetical protein